MCRHETFKTLWKKSTIDHVRDSAIEHPAKSSTRTEKLHFSFESTSKPLTSDEIQQLVSDAFADAPRPDVFTSDCPCDECADVNSSLHSCGDTLPAGLAWELPLLCPAAVRYLMPQLVRNALSDDADDDLRWNFVTMLGEPVSKSAPPDYLPFASMFNRAQFAAILAFLNFIHGDWYSNTEPPPKDVTRGIRNWEHFVQRAEQRLP